MLVRPAMTALASGAWLLALATPALAHPVTGGEATGVQIGLTVVGSILAIGGVIGALRADPSAPRRGRLPNTRNSSLIVAAVGLVVFIFGPDLLEPVTAPCEDRPATGASVSIVQPESGETIEGPEVPLKIDLAGGEITELSSVVNEEDKGHIHISIDGQLASMTGDAEQVIRVDPGRHQLEVEFVANDHLPFCSRIADRITFTVAEESG